MQTLDGILLVDKEKALTSYSIIRQLKKIIGNDIKIGHAGTLDPFATGLLIVLLGKSTKLTETIHKLHKTYTATAEFGYQTDTLDPTGKIIKRDKSLKNIDTQTIKTIIKQYFQETIIQTPPIYSAQKIKGKRAYDLARQGKKIKTRPKQVTIYRFETLKYKWPRVEFEIECSTGTYIRTLVSDLAHKLCTYATTVELRRTKIGEFSIEHAIPSQTFQ